MISNNYIITSPEGIHARPATTLIRLAKKYKSVVSLQKDDKNRVELNYSLTKGNKQSFKIRPVLIVIVDKIHDGPVSIKEQTD